MYRIDAEANRITPLEVKRFSELKFFERFHLQEWLENAPDAFGEELLIVQKEFDGFDDTRERLDLLALDKDGNLVVIENKLDDSGRDVVWQAMKYASYCANLSRAQVVDIYQRYLNQHRGSNDSEPANAEDKLCDFLGVEDLKEASINRTRSQRLIFVAARFRKEVTNVVLWLSQFEIACQCFKVTPYASGNDLFLNVEQIIPTPESREFMVGMAVKEAEEKTASDEIRQSHRLRLKFWEQALDQLRKGECRLYDNISPAKDHWLASATGISSVTYNMIFGKKEVRVELSFQRSNAEENRFLFDELESQKAEIEKTFGHQLIWLALPERKACRIQYAKAVDGYDAQNWPSMIDWLTKQIMRLQAAVKEPLQRAGENLKAR